MLRTTRRAGAFDRLMATALTFAITVCTIPGSVYAGPVSNGAAEISGIILLPDGLTPITGVKVKAANLETRQIYSSEKTAQDGVYTLTSLPAGTYDLAVETPDGLYAGDTIIPAVAGKRQVVSLAIRTAAQPGLQEGQEPPKPPEGPPPAEPEPKPEEPKAEPEPEQAKGGKRGKSFWRSPLGAGILVVGGAVVVGFAANSIVGDDDDVNEDDNQMSGTKRSN